MRLVVEQTEPDAAYLRILRDQRQLVDKQSVLVVEAEISDNLGETIAAERDERMVECIPRDLLAQTSVGEEVELDARSDSIMVRVNQHPRAGWDAAFAEMADAGDDRLLDGDQRAT